MDYILIMIVSVIFGYVLSWQLRDNRLKEQLEELREEFDACYTALCRKQKVVTSLQLDLRSATVCINMQKENAKERDGQIEMLAAEIKALTSRTQVQS